MLKSLRSSGSNVFVWVIILLLIIGLAGFGIGSSGRGGAATAVASVGEEPVTVDEYVRGLNQEVRRISSQFGQQISIEQLSAFGLDRQLLNQLLVDAAIDNEATAVGISASDDTVRERLMATPAFQGAGGGFSEQSYSFALDNANLEPAEYDEIVREEATRQIFRAVVSGGTRAPDTAAGAIMGYLAERRGVEWFRLLPSHLSAPIKEPTEEELKAFHSENADAYTLPETRTVTYAAVTEGQLVGDVEVSEEDIAALFEERQDQYSQPARRLVDRIVFGTREEALDALTAIQDGTRGFDEIAADRGLSAEDIDLGEVEETGLTPSERTMLFGSDALGVVGPVDTEFGPALYRVNAVLDASETTLDDARAELRDELAREEAASVITENADDIVDLIAGGATIEEVAQETILTLGTITIPTDETGTIADDAAFRDEALSADVGQDRDLIDLSDGVAYLRVDDIAAPRLQPLDDVRADVVAAWKAEETRKQLGVLGESIRARIDSGEAISDIATEMTLIVSEEAPLTRSDIIEDTPPEFVQAIFEATTGKSVFTIDDQSVLVGLVTEIVPADMNSEDVTGPLAAIKNDMSASIAQDLMAYFIGGIQESAGVSVNQPLIENIQSQIVHN